MGILSRTSRIVNKFSSHVRMEVLGHKCSAPSNISASHFTWFNNVFTCSSSVSLKQRSCIYKISGFEDQIQSFSDQIWPTVRMLYILESKECPNPNKGLSQTSFNSTYSQSTYSINYLTILHSIITAISDVIRNSNQMTVSPTF